MSNKPRDISEIPITPANYARLERIAYNIMTRGGQIPPQLSAWQQRAEQYYGSLNYNQQQRTLAELDTARYNAQRFDQITDQAIGRQQADQFFRDSSRGIAGNIEGVEAKRLREIAENQKIVKETRQARRNEQGGTIADPWTKKTQYETKRTESKKYSDSDARRAALILAFAKHDGARAERGADRFGGNDEIPDHKLTSSHADGDVAHAMLEVESKATVGEPLPTSTYENLDKGPNE
jgi:hypothetical protein